MPKLIDVATRERIYWDIKKGVGYRTIAKRHGVGVKTVCDIAYEAPEDDIMSARARICHAIGVRAANILMKVADKLEKALRATDDPQTIAAIAKATTEILKVALPPPNVQINANAGGDLIIDASMPEPVTEDTTVADAQDSTFKPS